MQRRAEDTLGARLLLGPVLAQIHVIDGLVRQARNPVRTAVLEVAAHYEEFAGWMYQDTIDTASALRHYDAAMEAAQEIGDADMVTSSLSLKSHLAWADNNAARALGLAAAGQHEQPAPRWPPGSCAGCAPRCANAVPTRRHARSPSISEP